MNTEAISAAIHDATHDSRVPGIIVGVARGAQPAEFIAIGSDANGVALHADTLFPMASVTKMATALAVLRLCDQQVLALDDPLEQHLPEAQAARPGVTLRALLCHSAGLPMEVSPNSPPTLPGSIGRRSAPPACSPHPMARRDGACNTGTLAMACWRW